MTDVIKEHLLPSVSGSESACFFLVLFRRKVWWRSARKLNAGKKLNNNQGWREAAGEILDECQRNTADLSIKWRHVASRAYHRGTNGAPERSYYSGVSY